MPTTVANDIPNISPAAPPISLNSWFFCQGFFFNWTSIRSIETMKPWLRVLGYFFIDFSNPVKIQHHRSHYHRCFFCNFSPVVWRKILTLLALLINQSKRHFSVFKTHAILNSFMMRVQVIAARWAFTGSVVKVFQNWRNTNSMRCKTAQFLCFHVCL